MIPVVRRIELLDEPARAFLAADYRAWDEYGIPGRFYSKHHDGTRTHKLLSFRLGKPSN